MASTWSGSRTGRRTLLMTLRASARRCGSRPAISFWNALTASNVSSGHVSACLARYVYTIRFASLRSTFTHLTTCGKSFLTSSWVPACVRRPLRTCTTSTEDRASRCCAMRQARSRRNADGPSAMAKDTLSLRSPVLCHLAGFSRETVKGP
eukprot:scaffold2859_cov349-Pavlova_lutheri.AAC.46